MWAQKILAIHEHAFSVYSGGKEHRIGIIDDELIKNASRADNNVLEVEDMKNIILKNIECCFFLQLIFDKFN